jgi:tRNA modification GTPase
VSDIAGTTRDTIEDELSIGGIGFRFIDTAGIRETEDVVESIGIKKTFEKIEQSQVTIYLFDSTKGITDLKSIQIELEKIKNKYPQKPLLIIANKIDLLDDSQLATLQQQIEGVQLLSAKTGFGVEQLTDSLLNLINTGALRNNETIVTNTRHYDALLKAFEEVQKVKYGLDSGLSGDLLAIDIRQTLYHFGEITGEITNDDLLGNIFANFCIGK